MITLASLGLSQSLFEVGYGLYERWSEHRARWAAVEVERERVRALEGFRTDSAEAFRRIEGALVAQAGVLAVLDAGQLQLRERLERLHAEIAAGFAGLHERLESQESRAFEVKARELLIAWRDLVELLALGHAPDAAELGRVRAVADATLAHADLRLAGLPVGDPRRLPSLVARATAVRAKADAFQLGGGPGAAVALRAIEREAGTLAAEVAELVRDRSLHAVGVVLADVLSAYVWLRRGLLAGIGRAGPAQWDDGLGAVREVLGDEGGDRVARTEAVKLRFIRDYVRYGHWAGVAPATLDVHSITEVPMADLLDRVGSPQPTVARASLPGLWEIGTPDFRASAEAKWREELGDDQLRLALGAGRPLALAEPPRVAPPPVPTVAPAPTVTPPPTPARTAPTDEALLALITSASLASSDFHVSPGIPTAKAGRAREIHGLSKDERILFLWDNTVFGGAADHVIATRRGLYWAYGFVSTGRSERLAWSRGRAVGVDGSRLVIEGHRIFFLNLGADAPRLVELLNRLGERLA